jgi:hypothetical protein
MIRMVLREVQVLNKDWSEEADAVPFAGLPGTRNRPNSNRAITPRLKTTSEMTGRTEHFHHSGPIVMCQFQCGFVIVYSLKKGLLDSNHYQL